ncbi:MAG: zinc ribbon domain-containing protein [Coriobacteriia bacterium]|nr:zinc ribbon domain-containing protein [Coriobacteriia bacterium]
MQAFTRNYEDNSTEAGFQFTFYCDCCGDGFKSSFIESETYKKGKGIRALSQGASVLGSLGSGLLGNAGWAADRAGDILGDRFSNASPEWQKEHEKAFQMAINEAERHFHRCPACQQYVCDTDWNEDEGMCINCAPRQEVAVAKARAEAMKRNIEEKAQNATVWQGDLESKTTICQQCGKPAGTGKFCNNCGASLALNVCPKCGAQNAQAVSFCNNCGTSMTAPASANCPSCGNENPPGTKFCGGCGTALG